MASRDVIFNEEETRNLSKEEIMQEQPVVDEHDERHMRFHHQLHHHLLNMLHPILQEAIHLLGKVVAANLSCKEVPLK